MSRLGKSGKEGLPELAKPSGLRRHAIAVRNDVVDRVRLAMKSLEADLESAVVSRSNITQAEVCRRAGIAKAALQKPSHRDSTLPEVQEWVLRTAATQGVVEPKAKGPERISDLQLSLKEVRQNFHEVELELVEAKSHIERLLGQLNSRQE